mmetsp:Transcript_51186/g.111302  ORF Transcript_51186/g.111302 Transcript_51186/m.111302 type:complete len:81 (+) Transcript_51186:370-612(+)
MPSYLQQILRWWLSQDLRNPNFVKRLVLPRDSLYLFSFFLELNGSFSIILQVPRVSNPREMNTNELGECSNFHESTNTPQ